MESLKSIMGNILLELQITIAEIHKLSYSEWMFISIFSPVEERNMYIVQVHVSHKAVVISWFL